MASRNLRNRTPISLKLAILDFTRGVGPIVDRQGALIETTLPDTDPLFTTPLHEAEISSVLLNLLTNAIKAVKRRGGERRIRIEAARDVENRLSLRFSDTGDGIREDIREHIFEPFITSQTAPAAEASERRHAVGTGLGLWIVAQIVGNLAGAIELIPPPTGFTTCFQITIPGEDAPSD
jgi:signal transduction histidine kinase